MHTEMDEAREYDARAIGAWKETGKLNTSAMLAASLAKSFYNNPSSQHKWKIPVVSIEDCKTITTITTKFHALAKVFEGAVWFLGGLQKRIKESSLRGWSGKGDGWKVLVWTCAGRTLLTFSMGEESISLITAEDEEPFTRISWGNESMGPMGIQSIDCTEATGLKLLENAIKHFPELQPDDKVTWG